MLFINKVKSIQLEYVETEDYTAPPSVVVRYSGHGETDGYDMPALLAFRNKAKELGCNVTHINEIIAALQEEVDVYNRIKPVDNIPAQF